MHFVLVHGWGFNASFWDPLIARLCDATVTRVDLGFVAGGPCGMPDWPQDAIAVGHSLGVLWLLKEGGGRFKSLVSLQGFDRYCPHVPKTRVMALQRGLDRDPAGTMKAFWGSCGVPDFADPAALDVPRLHEGLDWLLHWDAEGLKKSLQCPILSLATQNDLIVPPAMSEAVWGKENVIWLPSGGHALPRSHPDRCAKHVVDFANTVSS